jgi:hypothetical protein
LRLLDAGGHKFADFFDQIPRFEGLEQNRISACLPAKAWLSHTRASAVNNHWRLVEMGVILDENTDVAAAQTGQHIIQQNQIRVLIADDVKSFIAIPGG